MALIRTKKIEPIDFRQSAAQSFPFEDQEILLKALIKNFGIHATIQKDRSRYMFRLRRRSKSTERFVNLIRIHPCFDYKIQNSSGVASERSERSERGT